MAELWQGEVAKIKRMKRITNKDIAKAVGYSEIYVRLVLSGAHKSEPVKRRICKWLGIEI